MRTCSQRDQVSCYGNKHDSCGGQPSKPLGKAVEAKLEGTQTLHDATMSLPVMYLVVTLQQCMMPDSGVPSPQLPRVLHHCF